MPDQPEPSESVEARLQRLEEAQLFAQHDHEAVLAALDDLSQRFDTLMTRLSRLESRLAEASRADEQPADGESASDGSIDTGT